LYESPIVNEAINTLPKYRIQEINKLAGERNKVDIPKPTKPSSS